ncbi:unnamed protein product [Chrysodeixis includens]|uniref:Sulfide:quinone oxidoreductase, mitochondrial n=1 Tax=Chrysodeixis includens TaxID=689277 RepID=A0A9P0FT78_CHRIL|nr:unnamed protein product [Chrysodeixis includens]
MNILRTITAVSGPSLSRGFSASAQKNAKYSCKLLVVGGGSGGCTMAAKFARRFPRDAVIVLEPSKDHYYQPLWTLVGGGEFKVKDTHRLEADVLPKKAKWVQDYAEVVVPGDNLVKTREGHEIQYEYIIIAVGIDNDYAKVPGLYEALEDKNSGVSTIYSPAYAEKTFNDIKSFKGGEMLFTYPNSPMKCPGAPQKIAYLAESYLSANPDVRSKTHISYNTCLPVIFGVKKYATELVKVAERKNIEVRYRTVLKAVRHDKKEAVFYHKPDCETEEPSNSQDIVYPYDVLHVAPPMLPPRFLRENACIADTAGYLAVDKYTMQHVKYTNMYGIGDCCNTPNSKTAAAIAKQCYVVEQNLLHTMENDSPKEKYNGYGACPLLTSYNTCIMAEFVYDGVPRETFPFDQSKESKLAYYMKRDLFPFMYWNVMLKGYYHGPEFARKIFHPFQD